MKTFIKIIEIWVPDRERTQLEFGSGLYGAFSEFKSASRQEKFAYDEGLPGKAWAQGHPLILTQFEHSYFKRTALAQNAGLTCGIALPIFSGDFILAVVVFFCGDDEAHAGAIEIWSNANSASQSLSLLDGYYGTLTHFAAVSRQMSMPKGYGLPGAVWDSGMPTLIEDIRKSQASSRANDALNAGISTCLGIPFISQHAPTYVMTFLSAHATPIAKRIQIWMPDANGEFLVCQQGYSQSSNDLAEMFETTTVAKGEGALGRVWLSGMPVITGKQEHDYDTELDNLSSMLAIPVIEQGHLQAIVTFLF